MLKHICLYTNPSEYQAHTTWGGGYCQPHVQLRTDIGEVDFNQIIADENSNKPFIEKAQALKWINSASTYMTKYDASKPTFLGNWSGNTEVTGLTEFRFFTNIKAYDAEHWTLKNCSNLKEISMPPNVTSIVNTWSAGGFLAGTKLERFTSTKILNFGKGAFTRSPFNSFCSEYKGVLDTLFLGTSCRVFASSQNQFAGCDNIETLLIRPNFIQIGSDFWRGTKANFKRFIILDDKAPALEGETYLPWSSKPIYVPRGCDCSSIKKKYAGATIIECDKDKFGNLVLPFRLKKWWEPDV